MRGGALRCVGLLAWAASSGCVIESAPPAEMPARVEARQLALVDERGEPWAVLGRHGDNAGLFVSRPGSDAGVYLGVDPQGNTLLGLADPRGEPRVAFYVGSREGQSLSGLSLMDGQGKQRFFVALDQEGRALLTFASKDEQPRLVVREDGLAFLDASQRARLVLDLDDDGAPRVTALDAEGKETQLVPR